MNNTPGKMLAILNHLAGIAADGKNGYQKAAAIAGDVNLKDLFTRFSHERASYLEELHQLIKNTGAVPANHAGIPGSVHRSWIDLKAAVLPQNSTAIIYSCAIGEAVAIRAYTDALASDYIEGNIRSVISGQLSCINAALDLITNYGLIAIV